MDINLITTSEEWASLYFQKRGKNNQYTQFKNKAYLYQKYYTKLMLPKHHDDIQNKQNQTKISLTKLEDLHNELRNIFFQISQELKFMKFQTFSSLVCNFEEMFSTMHAYCIKNLIFYLKQSENYYQNFALKQIDQDAICKKCKENKQKINLQRLYKESTLTFGQTQNVQKVSKEDRLKMVASFDEYDLLLTEKDIYINKVNEILQNKHKVVQLSTKQRNVNYLADYLSNLEQIYSKKIKQNYQENFDAQQASQKWEEQSYGKILQYMKGVLYEHFISDSSAPVKKIFQKINLDKIFKSYNESQTNFFKSKQVHMKNNQTQTNQISEFNKLKNLQKSYAFCQKQLKIIKQNKELTQKKYISILQLNRKIQSQLTNFKYQKQSLQNQVNFLTNQVETLKKQTELLKLRNHEEKVSLIENHVKQRQSIISISKHLQTQFNVLSEEHSKCESQKAKKLLKKNSIILPQQNNLQAQEIKQQEQEQQDVFSKTQLLSSQKKRRDIRDKTKYSSFIHRKSIIGLVENFGNLKDQSNILSQRNILKQQKLQNLKIENGICQYKFLPNQQSHLNNQDLDQFNDYQNNKKKGDLRLSLKKNHQNISNFALESMKTIKKNEKTSQKQYHKNKNNKLSMQGLKKLKIQKDQQKNQKLLANFPKLTKKQNRLTEANQQFQDNINLSCRNNTTSVIQKRKQLVTHRQVMKTLGDQIDQNQNFQRVMEKGKQKFYIKKISRNSTTLKYQKEKLKQISHILKPYAYNNNIDFSKLKKKTPFRKRLSSIVSNFSKSSRQSRLQKIGDLKITEKSLAQQTTKSIAQKQGVSVGQRIIQIKNIIEAEFTYLKAVGFIDFLTKIGIQNKKNLKAVRKISSQIKEKFKNLDQNDLSLFGGKDEVYNYMKKKDIWSTVDESSGLIVYYKNDNLSKKVQRYLNLMKKANPQMYLKIMNFFQNPMFAVMGQHISESQSNIPSKGQKSQTYVNDLFNSIQKFHKIRHKDCTHVADFLQKIGYYKYSYF